MLKTRPWVPYLYVLPAFCLIGFVFAYPVVQVVNYSFRLIRGNSGPWVGFHNYELIFDDPTFRAAAKHSALLLLAVPILLAISVVLAVLLYERARGWTIYRSVFFFPFILAVPIVGIVASYMFTLNGVVNSLLGAIGIDGPDWIGDSDVRALDVDDRHRLARGRIRHHPLPRPAAVASRGADRGGPDRRGRLVVSPALRDPARAARHDRVLLRDRGDHDACLGVRLRLDTDERRAR